MDPDEDGGEDAREAVSRLLIWMTPSTCSTECLQGKLLTGQTFGLDILGHVLLAFDEIVAAVSLLCK